MITPSTIYWITRFDDIRTGLMFSAVAAVALAALTVALFFASVGEVSRDNEMRYMKLIFCFIAAVGRWWRARR